MKTSWRNNELKWLWIGLGLMLICPLVFWLVSMSSADPFASSSTGTLPGSGLVRAVDAAKGGFVFIGFLALTGGGTLFGLVMFCVCGYSLLSGPPKAFKDPKKTVEWFYTLAPQHDGTRPVSVLEAFVCLSEEARRGFGSIEGFSSYWGQIHARIEEKALAIPLGNDMAERLDGCDNRWFGTPDVTVSISAESADMARYEAEIICKLIFGKGDRRFDVGMHRYRASGKVKRNEDRWYLTDGHWLGVVDSP